MKRSLKEKLHEEGLRCTQPRRCIVEALESGPKTHAELLKLTRLDRVTVYRNLLALQKIGLIYRVYLASGEPYYVLCDAETPTHAHFFCEKCHQAMCLPDETIQVAPPWAERVERVLLVGKCAQCA